MNIETWSFSRFLSFWKFQTFDLKKFESMDIVYTWSQCLRMIVWTHMCRNFFWISGLGANFPGKKGWWTLRPMSFFKVYKLLKIPNIWFKEVWMYGYSLYLVTVFRMIVWTRMWKLFWVLGLGTNFPGKKGWWTVRLSDFPRFLSYWKFQKFDLKKFECMDILYTWSQCLGW